MKKRLGAPPAAACPGVEHAGPPKCLDGRGRSALPARGERTSVHDMPSLLRLLVVLGLLGGLAYAAMFALANFVQPKPREITVTIPQDRLAKPR